MEANHTTSVMTTKATNMSEWRRFDMGMADNIFVFVFSSCR